MTDMTWDELAIQNFMLYFFRIKFINQPRMKNKTMKDKENKRQESEEQENKRGLELGVSGGLSIFGFNYPPFLAYDLTPNLREEPIPEDEKKEKLSISDEGSEDLEANKRAKIIEQFKSYSTKIKPPME
jgi:hypothetical protein